MRWSPLARKEYRTVVRSKSLWLLAVLLPLWGYQPGYDTWQVLGPNMTVAFLQYAMLGAAPLAVLLLSYNSIVGERETGSIKFTLGLPLTRTEILLAKVVGRWAGACVPLSVSLVALTVVGIYHHGFVSPLVWTGVAVATVLYVLTLVALATAASALTSRSVRAVAATFGAVYLVGVLGWIPLVRAGYGLVTPGSINLVNQPTDGPLFLLLRLGPSGAYNVLTNWILGVGNSAAGAGAVAVQVTPDGSTTALVVDAAYPPGTSPAYLHEAGGLLVLLGWLVGSLAVARYSFARGDLV